MVCPCSDSCVDGVCSKKLTVVLSEWADFSTVLIIMQYQTKTLHHMVLYRRKVGYAPSSDCCTNLQSSQPHIHSHSHHICSCILHVLVIVQKSSCTRYNGTRGRGRDSHTVRGAAEYCMVYRDPPRVPLYPVQLDFRTIIDLLYSWAIQRHQAGT